MLYLISYDLNEPGQNYDGLKQAISALGETYAVLRSTILLCSDRSVSDVYNAIKGVVDDNDEWILTDVSGVPADKSCGRIQKKDNFDYLWQWIKSRNEI